VIVEPDARTTLIVQTAPVSRTGGTAGAAVAVRPVGSVATGVIVRPALELAQVAAAVPAGRVAGKPAASTGVAVNRAVPLSSNWKSTVALETAIFVLLFDIKLLHGNLIELR
jgi:hypothetical protein